MIYFEVKINPSEVKQAVLEEEIRIERALNRGVDRILREIENSQIRGYTSTGNPPLPAGSTYIRSFDLQNASQTQRTSKILPEIGGVWSVNEGKAKHGKYVLGKRAEQAKIHRDRWKPTEQVESEVQEKTPRTIEEELRKL